MTASAAAMFRSSPYAIFNFATSSALGLRGAALPRKSTIEKTSANRILMGTIYIDSQGTDSLTVKYQPLIMYKIV